jgi:ATP-dependent Clp protease ATP-binding subunit ClpB
MDMTTRSQQAVSSAVRSAAEHGNPAVEPAHLTVALLDEDQGLTRPLLQSIGVDPGAVRAAAQRAVDQLPSASGASVAAPQPSRAFLAVLSAAERAARDRQDEYVSTEHLLIGLAQ